MALTLAPVLPPSAVLDAEPDGTPHTFDLASDEPLCVSALLADSTVEVSTCVRAEPGASCPTWSASVDFFKTPIPLILPFLPGSAKGLGGGTVSGHLDLEGIIGPESTVPQTIECRGTLSPDSVWWSRDSSRRGIDEWFLIDSIFDVSVTSRSDTSGTVFTGLLKGQGGIVRYLGHEFSVAALEIRPVGTPGFDPVVELSAAAWVNSNMGQRYRVGLIMEGPASRAELRLISSPRLSPPDIRSLLTLGIPLCVFAEDGSIRREDQYWAQQVFLLRAIEVAAERIVGLAEHRAQQLLGLDVADVPDPGDPAGQSEMELAKRLGRRATLSYTSPVWHSSDYRVRLDFMLSDHFSIESENNQTGEAGVDLRFKMRAR